MSCVRVLADATGCTGCCGGGGREVRKHTMGRDPWILHRLAEWRVVQSKLLPMMLTYLEDKCV